MVRGRARRDPSDQFAVEEDTFVHPGIGINCLDLEGHHFLLQATVPLAHQCVTALEVVFIPFDKAIEAGFKRCVFKVKVPVDRAVGFFKPQGFNGPISAMLETVGFAGPADLFKKMQVVGDRMVELPAEFAFIVDAHHPHIRRQSHG